DLAIGNTRDAAYITQDLLQRPDGVQALQAANQMADVEARQYGRYRAAEHVLPTRNGQEVLVNDRGQMLANCGSIYEGQNMIGPGQYAPSSACLSNTNCFADGSYNCSYNGSYNNGAYYNSYPNNGVSNAVSFGFGTLAGLTISGLF